MSEPRMEPDPGPAIQRAPLPRGFRFAAAWLAFGFVCAVWPLTRAFSGYTGILIEAPASVGVTALLVFAALLAVWVNLLRLRPGGVWLSISIAAIFAFSGLLRMPTLVAKGEPGVIWVVGISSLLHAVVAIYLSRPGVLAVLERRRLER
ncbi:MAG TPA: hypothetical protein VGS03_01550 [Candidatus Polarisedimenticolia bacterium]|nr:hypothetical protein [Candidatus Polarisedimenticolia bacterium]